MGEYFIYNGELYHYGVKGMKWGVRRAQRRAEISKYRKEYDALNEHSPKLSKTVNKLAGSDRAYARSKYNSKNAASSVKRAKAAGNVARIESIASNRGTHKPNIVRKYESTKAYQKAYFDSRMKSDDRFAKKVKKNQESRSARKDFLSKYSTGDIVATGIVKQIRNATIANIASGIAAKTGHAEVARMFSVAGTAANIISASTTIRDLNIKRRG